jgi:hypothetical protein
MAVILSSARHRAGRFCSSRRRLRLHGIPPSLPSYLRSTGRSVDPAVPDPFRPRASPGTFRPGETVYGLAGPGKGRTSPRSSLRNPAVPVDPPFGPLQRPSADSPRQRILAAGGERLHGLAAHDSPLSMAGAGPRAYPSSTRRATHLTACATPARSSQWSTGPFGSDRSASTTDIPSPERAAPSESG